MAKYVGYIYIEDLITPHFEAIEAPSLPEAVTAACRLLKMFESGLRVELFDRGRRVARLSYEEAGQRLKGDDPLTGPGVRRRFGI